MNHPGSLLHQDGPERHIVWVCCGCDNCEPLDGSERGAYPCDSDSMGGQEVVLGADYDAFVEARENERELLLTVIEGLGMSRTELARMVLDTLPGSASC